MKVMVLGITGMLGNAMFRVLKDEQNLDVYGTARSDKVRHYFREEEPNKIIVDVDVENHDSLVRAFSIVRPDIIVNCIGLVKQLADVNDPLQAIPINTLLPHRLASLCQVIGARLVHISTDCVFSGKRGDYLETDFPDANDLYGRSKLLGEVDYPHAITLRTSIIGHELLGQRSLIGWFLSQDGPVKGFTKAIFSGLPTVELSRVVRDIVLPRPELRGLYHIAAKPINKFDLLHYVADTYRKKIEIVPSDELVIDRSLNADKFCQETGYIAPEWPELVKCMYKFK